MTRRAASATFRIKPPPQNACASGLRPLPLVFAMHLALAGGATLGLGCSADTYAQGSLAAAPSGADAVKRYDIPAGPLGTVMTRFAGTSGVLLAGSSELVQGRNSPGLSGTYTTQAAIDALLAGTGLEAVRQADGSYSLRQAPTAMQGSAPRESLLPTVAVNAAPERSIQNDGTAAQGYRARTVTSLGALGGADLLDLPFSMSVVPQELIQNIQAQSPDDIYKLNPSTRTIVAQGTGWSPMVSIRGFSTYDSAEDGLRRPYNHAAVIEDKERVEVLNGLSGFMYGAAAPAGIVNYVYKRPTRETLNNVTVGNYGGDQYYVHGDFGGRIDEEGRVGYRLNVVKQNGQTAIDAQKIDRTLISAALDWNPTDKLSFGFNAVYNHYKTQSPTAYWYYEIPHGAAPDASRNWSQPWIKDEFENTKLMGKVSYQFNDHVTFRGAYSHSTVDRPVQDHTLNDVSTAGSYDQIAIHSGKTKNNFDAAQALFDVKFNTGPVAHTITTGYFMYATKDWGTSYSPNTGWNGPYSLSAPVVLPVPTYPANTSSPYVAGTTANKNFVIGDNIKFSERWSLLVGITHSRILTQDFDSSGAKSQPDYNQSRNSPSASLLFKPLPWLTTYGSYIEGLEMGGRAPTTAANSNSVMPPMISRQRELGIKADAGGMLLTAAAFDIEKAYEYTDASNVYTQNGRERHKGMEFTATGKLTRKFTLLGGLTAFDAAIKGGDYDGKEPINVAKVVAKLYAEYELPIPGLVTTGGIYYTGKQWADESNTDRLPAYTTVDLGLRYTTKAAGRPLILRLYASNVANKNYWANSYYTGAPRSVAFSAQYQF